MTDLRNFMERTIPFFTPILSSGIMAIKIGWYMSNLTIFVNRHFQILMETNIKPPKISDQQFQVKKI